MSLMTLNYIKRILDSYIQDLSTYDSADEVTYKKHETQTNKKLVECFNYLSSLHPELFQVNMSRYLADDDAKILKTRFRENAKKRYSLDILPSAGWFLDTINNESIFTPAYVLWQREDSSLQNFVINYDNTSKHKAKDALNGLLMNMMLCLPVKKLLLNFFDFTMSGLADLFTVNLEPQLYHDDIIVDQDNAHQRLKLLLAHMATVMKQYGNLASYNNSHQEIALPYEVVVLNNYPSKYDGCLDLIAPLFENGARCGIYFIVMNNTDCSLRDKDAKSILDVTHNYQTLTLYNPDEKNEGLVSYTPFHRNPLLARVCFDYFREEANYIPKRTILKQNFNSVLSQTYEPVISEICVTVGLDIDKKQPVTLRFNSGDYIHAFILGQSGSGKSVLLNNIITTAINKYSPEDLILYLMDFKGVEFNRYRGVKHTKAVLVDNSDPQLTLEVLRELKEENKRRVKLWQQEGVNNIDGYNSKHRNNRLPQVLFVADECQVMFSRIDAGINSYRIQREIAEIVNIIATQGRSQGIHMLLATQQLDETDISGQVLKNLTECLLFMSAPSDSNMLVPDSSNLTAQQPTGQCCYYHKKELQAQLQSFYATDDELEKAIAESQKKAFSSKSNGEVYFKGTSMFWWNEDERNTMLNNNNDIIASVGRNIGIKEEQTIIPLHRDFSENILFFGTNKEEQTVGVTINALISLIASYNSQKRECDVIIIDCFSSNKVRYKTLLNDMQDKGLCITVSRTESGAVLNHLANAISHSKAVPTILVIIGCECFAEMKRNSPIVSMDTTMISANTGFDISSGVVNMDFFCNDDGSTDGFEEQIKAMKDKFAIQSNDIEEQFVVHTYPEALRYILDEGPIQGVHVLLQVDKPTNILFEDYPDQTVALFKHKVILRSENKYLVPMRFSTDIDVETLGEEEERLRAYYYPEDGSPQLFTPYLMPEKIII